MRKIILTTLTLATSIALNAQTQIGNSGFESWENVTGGSEPTNWNSFLTASGSMTSFASNQITQVTDNRPGSTGTKCVRLHSRSVLGINANGVLTVGRVNMGSSSPSSSDNYNHTVTSDANFSEAITDFPDSIVFWAKFNPNGHNQNARMIASLHDNYAYRDPENTAAAPHRVATALLNFPKTNSTWVRKSVPFVYDGQATSINYILITFATNQTPGGGAADDYLWVDDVELIYNQASLSSNKTSVCKGGNVTFSNTSLISSGVTSYSWSFPGGSPATSTAANPTVTYNTAGTYDVTLTITNGFGSRTITMNNYITVNNPQDASFNYSGASFCSNIANPTPSAVETGTYTSTSGLVFADATTGEINLAASTAGAYTITHTTSGACPGTATQTVTILQAPDASFNYPSNTICTSGGNQTPMFSTSGGTFTADNAGLIFVSASSGEIDVAGSNEGTYEITYSVPDVCPAAYSVNVTLTSAPDATFSYGQASYCVNDVDPAPIYVSGANAGVFSAGSGLSINPNNGVIDLSASSAGSYTVTNDINITGCPQSTKTYTVVVNDLPTVGLTLPQTTVCTYNTAFLLTGGAPAGGTYTGTGVGAGLFNPAAFPGGGVATIKYTYTDASTSCTNFTTATITVDECLGVETIENLSSVTVYPNPTNGMVKIDNISAPTMFVIISTAGQIVRQGELTTTETMIDLSDVENGIYLLQLKQAQDAKTVRLIKQ
ncbi:MAG: PKD domain-containing protein [Crocinitomicaceae bacterium]|nr:PKD domain-containing protein [Crocinitomicaceae bacterium]